MSKSKIFISCTLVSTDYPGGAERICFEADIDVYYQSSLPVDMRR